MGCIVNGPGEMADADFGYVGGAPGKIDLYVGKVCPLSHVWIHSIHDAIARRSPSCQFSFVSVHCCGMAMSVKSILLVFAGSGEERYCHGESYWCSHWVDQGEWTVDWTRTCWKLVTVLLQKLLYLASRPMLQGFKALVRLESLVTHMLSCGLECRLHYITRNFLYLGYLLKQSCQQDCIMVKSAVSKLLISRG